MQNQANILAYERQRLFLLVNRQHFLDQANGDDTIEDVFLLSRFSRLLDKSRLSRKSQDEDDRHATTIQNQVILELHPAYRGRRTGHMKRPLPPETLN